MQLPVGLLYRVFQHVVVVTVTKREACSVNNAKEKIEELKKLFGCSRVPLAQLQQLLELVLYGLTHPVSREIRCIV